jgi:glycosyltransferase involved in cell wall biosynthesis
MTHLSIITITYNAERFLERTILSILNAKQDLNIEYFVIDGGSKDGTIDIIRKYQNDITRWISEPDGGLYDAMNKGLAMATGDYLWFLNAGDEIHDEQVLSRLFERFESNADIYYSDALFVNDDGSAVGLRSKVTPHSLPHNLKWQDMALGMKVCHQAFIVRRTIAPKYDISNLSADIGWEIECLKASVKTMYLDFVLCKYLTGGLSVQKHRQSLIDRFKVLYKHFGLLATVLNHVRIFWRKVYPAFVPTIKNIR